MELWFNYTVSWILVNKFNKNDTDILNKEERENIRQTVLGNKELNNLISYLLEEEIKKRLEFIGDKK